MSWGFPPIAEETIQCKKEAKELADEIVNHAIKLDWNIEFVDDHFLHFTRKQKNKLSRFLLLKEKTDITVKIKDSGQFTLTSFGPNFFVDAGINRKNIQILKNALKE